MQFTVADGYRLGCGMILAGLTVIFGLVILATVVVFVATLLNLPLPFLPPRT